MHYKQSFLQQCLTILQSLCRFYLACLREYSGKFPCLLCAFIFCPVFALPHWPEHLTAALVNKLPFRNRMQGRQSLFGSAMI